MQAPSSANAIPRRYHAHPRYLADAIFDGHRLGRELESPNPERPLSIRRERPVWGTGEEESPGRVVP